MNIEDGLKHSFIALNFFLHILSSEQKALYDITWAACERTNDKNWLGYQNKKFDHIILKVYDLLKSIIVVAPSVLALCAFCLLRKVGRVVFPIFLNVFRLN